MIFSIVMGIFLLLMGTGFAQQIDIPRIEQMPNIPDPYEMRDWKSVTLGYDSLVFDFDQTDIFDYLPLIWLNTSTVNYPNHYSFGLQTAVGTYSPRNAEAINILPAVVSASLVGIDKSDQNGYNWVEMCEEFFNKRAEENVYLNGWVTSSGNDWWYDTMPNIFSINFMICIRGRVILIINSSVWPISGCRLLMLWAAIQLHGRDRI